MTCDEYLSIVEEDVEDSLDPQTSDQATTHVAACGTCRIVYQELKNEQEIYSRYLLKIKERPDSWDVVRREIKKENNIAAAKTEAVEVGFYERLTAIFFRQPVFGTMALLILIIGIGFGLWQSRSLRRDDARPEVGSSNSKESDLSLNEKKNEPNFPDNSVMEGVKVKPPKNELRIQQENKRRISPNKLTAASVRPGEQKKRARPMSSVARKINESSASFDSSETAFNRHLEKCEMVLRLFRNAVPETDKSGFDISYERRLAKELLNHSIRFRREAQSQGNLPVEQLLAGLETILGEIAKLSGKATLSDANLIKGRIQESGIIVKLQIQSSAARISD